MTLAVLTLTACGALSLVTGCASEGLPAPPPNTSTVSATGPLQSTTTAPALSGVSRTSIDDVADTVCVVWFGWNTVTDSGPYDASLRAVRLLDPSTVTELLTHPAVNGPGADWLMLAASRAVASVSVTPAHESGVPADSDTTAYRLRIVTQTFVGDPPPVERRSIVELVLRRNFDGWRAVSVATR